MRTSEQINEISKAISMAQGEINPAIKNATNPHFRNDYADYNALREAVREPLSKYEIAYLHDVTTVDNRVCVLTKLTHSSGQWMEFGPIQFNLQRTDPQAVGSAVTYGKRYGLASALGISSGQDDDAESTYEGRGKPSKEKLVIKREEKPKPTPINEEEYERFLVENELNNPSSQMYGYIADISKKRKMQVSEMLEYCFRNKDGFFKSFNDYLAENTKKNLIQSEKIQLD